MGPLGSIGSDLRGCCVEGVYTLFMLCHSLQLVDYERCAPYSFVISDWVPIVKNWCGGDYL